jgi:hypothetical protein
MDDDSIDQTINYLIFFGYVFLCGEKRFFFWVVLFWLAPRLCRYM